MFWFRVITPLEKIGTIGALIIGSITSAPDVQMAVTPPSGAGGGLVITAPTCRDYHHIVRAACSSTTTILRARRQDASHNQPILVTKGVDRIGMMA